MNKNCIGSKFDDFLEEEENIRDIVAFPKNGAGVDLMMGSPSAVDASQLEEARIAILPDED